MYTKVYFLPFVRVQGLPLATAFKASVKKGVKPAVRAENDSGAQHGEGEVSALLLTVPKAFYREQKLIVAVHQSVLSSGAYSFSAYTRLGLPLP